MMAISLSSIKKLIPSWNDITFKPITLSGYGINTIQEAKISLAANTSLIRTDLSLDSAYKIIVYSSVANCAVNIIGELK